jgi:hypothetical protein
METPVISVEKIDPISAKEAIKNLATEQPHVMGALIGEYSRLPNTAILVYHLLRGVMTQPLVTISKETVEALDSVIQTDKAKLGQEFIKEQPQLGEKLMTGYDYVPKPALLIYFGYKNQCEANEMNGSNLFKEPTEEEKHLKYLIQQVYQSLPNSKDWLDPVLEAEMKDIATK